MSAILTAIGGLGGRSLRHSQMLGEIQLSAVRVPSFANAAWGTSRPDVMAEAHQWVKSDSEAPTAGRLRQFA